VSVNLAGCNSYKTCKQKKRLQKIDVFIKIIYHTIFLNIFPTCMNFKQPCNKIHTSESKQIAPDWKLFLEIIYLNQKPHAAIENTPYKVTVLLRNSGMQKPS
jgi:hypothetical protein